MTPTLIVMLTQNDLTVSDAALQLEHCLASGATHIGFKEQPLPAEEMKRLADRIHQCGRTACLEVVAYTEEEGLRGAQAAIDCGTDILMGTRFSPTICQLCHDHGLRYFPFVGELIGRPTVLGGSIEQIISEAHTHLAHGADGIDLLAYRHQDNPEQLIRQFSSQVQAPVVIAGSINSHERLQLIMDTRPWGFTIGSAFFEHRFGDTLTDQIDHVLQFLR